MYFVYSKDSFLLEKNVHKILKNLNCKDEELESFSFIDDSFEKIIEAIQTPSFFSEKKIVLLKDSWFVAEKQVSLHKTFNLETLLKILRLGTCSNNFLIFTLNSDKFSKKLKTSEWFLKNAQVIFAPCFDEEMTKKFIIESFLRKNLTISREAALYLVSNLPKDMQIIDNELKKIIQLQKDIDLEDVKENLTKYFDEDIFKISNAFLKNEISEFLMSYRDYRSKNNENLPLITLLGNNLAIMRNALILQKQGLNYQEIANRLEINSYRLKLLLQTNKNTIKKLNDRIIMLYNLNKDLILGKIDNQVLPEYKFIKVLS